MTLPSLSPPLHDAESDLMRDEAFRHEVSAPSLAASASARAQRSTATCGSGGHDGGFDEVVCSYSLSISLYGRPIIGTSDHAAWEAD